MGTRGKEQDHCLKINLLLLWLSEMEIIKTLGSAPPHQNEMVGQPGRWQLVSGYLSGCTGCSAILARRGTREGEVDPSYSSRSSHDYHSDYLPFLDA